MRAAFDAAPRSVFQILSKYWTASDRIWTIPNALSVLRLLGVPLFLWLLLGLQADGWALVVLILSAATDWADGKLARLLDQYSKLGSLSHDREARQVWRILAPQGSGRWLAFYAQLPLRASSLRRRLGLSKRMCACLAKVANLQRTPANDLRLKRKPNAR